MSKLTVDIKVLGREDAVLKLLLQSLLKQKWQVTVFISAVNNDPTFSDMEALLTDMGILKDTHYTHLQRFNADNVFGIARSKAEYCRDHDVTIALEIGDVYIEQINKLAKQTNTYLLRRFV